MKGIVDLYIKESLQELEAMQKKCSASIKPRIKMLIALKGEEQLTKTQLAQKLNVAYNSITKWQGFYEQGGIDKLLEFKIGNNRWTNGQMFLLPQEIYNAIEKQHNIEPFQSYAAMHRWVKANHKTTIKCSTLTKYIDNYFGDKLNITSTVQLVVSESRKELEKVHELLLPRMKPRLKMLLCLKKGKTMLRLGLAKEVGAAYGSVAKWITLYKQGGMQKLLEYNVLAVITPEVHKFIEKQFAENKFKNFPKLYAEINEKYIPGIKYFTLHRYVLRHFEEELKLAKGPQLDIKESLQELEGLYKNCKPRIKARIFMLITIKNNTGIRKSELALHDGIKQDSVYRWCKIYEQGGINALLDIKMSGRKRFAFPQNVHNAIELKLKRSPAMKITALHKWLVSSVAPGISYNKLYRYVQWNFEDLTIGTNKSRSADSFGYHRGFAA